MKPKDAPKITFPCNDYLIKVVGESHPDYKSSVAEVLVKYDSSVSIGRFSERPSRNGRFVSLNIRMRIEQATDLVLLHDELKANRLVKMVL